MSEYGYIPEAPEQSFGNNKGIFNPKDIYDLTRADKYTNYGQLELIETVDISTSASTDFTTLGNYNVHFMTFNNMQVHTDSKFVAVRLSTSGTFYTSSYQNAQQYGYADGTGFGEVRSTNNNYWQITWNLGTGTNERGNGYLYFYNLLDSAKYSFGTWQQKNVDQLARPIMGFGSFLLPQSVAIDGIKILANDGTTNISGNISLYGIKEYS